MGMILNWKKLRREITKCTSGWDSVGLRSVRENAALLAHEITWKKKTIQLSEGKPKADRSIFHRHVLKESERGVCVSFYKLFVKLTNFSNLFFICRYLKEPEVIYCPRVV